MPRTARVPTLAAGFAVAALLAGCGQGTKEEAAAPPAEPVAAAPAVAPAPVTAAPLPDGTQRVEFAAGSTSATFPGAVKGYDTPLYAVAARQGQTMTVTLTGSPNVSINIFAPGDLPGASTAMYIGETSGNRFSGPVPETGDYLIQLGQPRAQARRDETSDYSLEIGVAGG